LNGYKQTKVELFAVMQLLIIWIVLWLPIAYAIVNVQNILFVGNSLTKRNDLPKVFASLAKAGKKKVRVDSSLLPSATFQEHVAYGSLDKIQSKNWSVIVLQEQSNYLARGSYFAESASWPFAEILRNAAGPKARVILYETMAYVDGFNENEDYDGMQNHVIEQYERLRIHLKCETCHVGKTWQLAFHELQARNKSVPDLLYSDGEVHPSPTGTFLAACAFYAKIFNESPTRLSPTPPKGVPKYLATLAKQWANDTYFSTKY
jgi:hypothetical protein